MLCVDDEPAAGQLGDVIANERDGPDGAGVEQPCRVVDDLLGLRFRRVGGTEGGRDREEPCRYERGEPDSGDGVVA